MLTTFLCGIALGSVLVARISDRVPNLVALIGLLQVGVGVYGLLTIAILGRLFYGLDAWWDGFSHALVTPAFRFSDIAGEPEKQIRTTRRSPRGRAPASQARGQPVTA